MTDLVKVEVSTVTIKNVDSSPTKLIDNSAPIVVKIALAPTKVIATHSKTKITTIGIQGVAGIDGDKHYTHVQGVASAEWTIQHPLIKFPSITTVDSAGNVVVGEEQMIDLNTVKIIFSAPFSGKAYLN